MDPLDLSREQWQRIKGVISDALELPRERRAAMLESRFADDPTLQACALDMLQHYDNATRPFDAFDSHSSGFLPVARSAGRPLDIGESLTHYHILQKLGEGGMGVIYLARDERLGREVALKVLSPAVRATLKDAKAQLLAESRSIAFLNHPGIVTLHDIFEIEGELVTVMEYVKGAPLSDMMVGDPQPIGFALRLTVQLADALAYAHGRGVIHCDLKPDNIHILPGGIPKILDFGLARILTGSDSDAAGETALFGTPGYMAPERLMGRPPSAAADVYALGVIFYQLVTGAPPFDVTDNGQLFLAAMTATPSPPSRLIAGLPESIDGLALQCLAKHPRERLQPHELSRLLRDVLQTLETAPIAYVSTPQVDTAALTVGTVVTPATSRWPKGVTTTLLASTAAAVLFTIFGLITSTSYNQPLGRVGEMSESWWLWPIWGGRAMFAVLAWAAMLGLSVIAAAGVFRLLLATISPLRRGMVAIVTRLALLDNMSTAVIAPVWLLLQLAVLGGVTLHFQKTLIGLDSFLTRRYQALEFLSPLHRNEHRLLGEVVATQAAVFCSGWLWLALRRRGDASVEGRAYIAAGVVVTAVSLAVFQAVPYRIIFHSQAERVVYGSEQCYLVAQSGNDVMLFCPLRASTWAQVAKANDPRLQRQGTVESIFAGFDRQ